MNARELESRELRGLEGQTLNGYFLFRTIAVGGMATVYLARKLGPRGFAQNAAVKVVHPHLAAQPHFVEMFLDEARIVSCINHPNVCRVFDFGSAEGTHYLALEYVRGETWLDTLAALAAHPRGREAIPAVVAWVVAQACEGLHAAHEARDEAGVPLQIVHRDVSPQNLLVGYDGSVRVVDFGVAYAAERSHATRDGAVKGRYAYMAPEQMRGLPVDRRADLWSLGVILREALQGERLFARENDAATIYAVTDLPLPTWPAHVPAMLRAIVDRALARDPAQRYATAREMGKDLARMLEGGAAASVSLSEWMQVLFAERIAEKIALVRELSNLAGTAGSRSGEMPLGQGAETVAPVPSGGSSVRELSRRMRALQAASRGTKWRRNALLGALGCGLLSAVGALCSREEPSSSVQSRWAAAPSAPSSEPAAAVQEGPSTSAQPGQTAPQSATPAPREDVVEPSAPSPERVPASESAEEQAPARRQREPSSRSVFQNTKTAQSARRGSVALFATGGWADVFLGSRRLGTTPVVVSLPVGHHTFTIYPSGQGPARRVRLEVRAGAQTKHKLSL